MTGQLSGAHPVDGMSTDLSETPGLVGAVIAQFIPSKGLQILVVAPAEVPPEARDQVFAAIANTAIGCMRDPSSFSVTDHNVERYRGSFTRD